MEDKNREQSIPSGPYGMRQYVVCMCDWCSNADNCPTTEWHSWKYVHDNVKKVLIDQLLCNYTLDDMNEELMKLMEEMSNFISNRRAASSVSQTPSPAGSAATISPPDMAMKGAPLVMPFGPTVSTVLASSTSLVTHPLLSTRRTHRRLWSSEEAEQFSEASSVHGEGSQSGNASFS
ncbi:hypothetical protein C1H46_024763 [Malus baccata]|uniref:Uncharacterized protein n=1 Tax=Malus baccata TaxID=106549 RepID=A0A540LT96_MALBA|nr:hypothetical protein C1H46_024763 [Malus baccata]